MWAVLAALPLGAQPNYSDLQSWAAHPHKHDPADSLLLDYLTDVQDTATVDVFYVYPTMYGGRKFKRTTPNAGLDHAALNEVILAKPVLLQASVFNGVGRVFCPFYRQVHISYYFEKDKQSAQTAFDTAYADVLAAFRHFIDVENQGRPFIIAGHSQGSTHLIRLLKEQIDGQPLQNRLVAAYLAGMPVRNNTFTHIPVCTSPDQTGCFCSWRAVQHGSRLRGQVMSPDIVVTNPLSWSTDDKPVPDTWNIGGVMGKDKILPHCVSAQIHAPTGLLWCSRPQVPGIWLVRNYHPGDINLFYLNIRENARLRAASFGK